MKKVILLIIVLIFSTGLTGCGIFNLNGWLVPDDAEFTEVIESLRTPQKISDYMIENFEYKAYPFTVLNPYELFLYKKGDCDIFAKFGAFAADYHNYETYQIKIFYSGTIIKHRIAIYVEDDGLSFTDNQYYFNNHGYFFNTFREIVEYDNTLKNDKIWSKYTVYDYDNNIIEKGHNNQ